MKEQIAALKVTFQRLLISGRDAGKRLSGFTENKPMPFLFFANMDPFWLKVIEFSYCSGTECVRFSVLFVRSHDNNFLAYERENFFFVHFI